MTPFDGRRGLAIFNLFFFLLYFAFILSFCGEIYLK